MSAHHSTAQVIRTLFPLVDRREKRRFGELLILAFFMAASELFLAGLVALLAAVFGSPETVINRNPVLWIRETFGVTFGHDPRFLALAVLIAIFIAIVVKNVLVVIQQRQLVMFSENVGMKTKSHVFRFYQRAPLLWLVQKGVVNLGFGLGSCAYVANVLSFALQIFTSLLMLLTLFVGLVVAAPLPSLMFLAVLGIGGTIIVKLARGSLDRCSTAAYNADYNANKITHLALHGLKEIRLYNRENSLFSFYGAQLKNLARAKVKLQTVSRLPVCTLEILGFLTLVTVMLFLVFVQDAGMARISGIMGFMAAAAWRGLPMANRLVDALTQFRAGFPYLQIVTNSVLAEKALTRDLLPLPDGNEPPLFFEREIRLENVVFRYPMAQEDSIKDISMTIRAGTMVGVVGLSGAGKSTLVNILTGLMPPDSGRVLVDGTAIARDTSAAWLRKIGYVAQAPYILDASLAENVALSRWGEPVDRERVRECCRMAALDFLDELEEGMDTVLGERGTRLSGGQAQRVAIARALYSDPALIIFDEATSALDMKNEKAIHETILSLRSHVTMVIIAHRLTTVEGCDEIIWLDKGAILHQGKTERILSLYSKTLVNQNN